MGTENFDGDNDAAHLARAISAEKSPGAVDASFTRKLRTRLPPGGKSLSKRQYLEKKNWESDSPLKDYIYAGSYLFHIFFTYKFHIDPLFLVNITREPIFWKRQVIRSASFVSDLFQFCRSAVSCVFCWPCSWLPRPSWSMLGFFVCQSFKLSWSSDYPIRWCSSPTSSACWCPLNNLSYDDNSGQDLPYDHCIVRFVYGWWSYGEFRIVVGKNPLVLPPFWDLVCVLGIGTIKSPCPCVKILISPAGH